jgi:hypothetical protein
VNFFTIKTWKKLRAKQNTQENYEILEIKFCEKKQNKTKQNAERKGPDL